MSDDAVTSDQEKQLSAVMAELNRLTTPGLIFESARLRLPDEPTDTDKTRFRMAYAGVVAATKIESYMVSMRQANTRRLQLGKRIRDLNDKVRDLRITDPVAAIPAAVEVPKLSGLQEVEVHTFVIAINAIQKLLPFAARAAGFKISATDKKTLLQFEPLRDFYEHIEQRLPGSKHPKKDQAFQEPDDESGWYMKFELPTDADGYILIDGNRIDVSSGGVSKVQDVVERTWASIRESALADAEKFFRANPDRLPDPAVVDSGFETKVGGPLRQAELFQFNDEDFEKVGAIWLPVRYYAIARLATIHG